MPYHVRIRLAQPQRNHGYAVVRLWASATRENFFRKRASKDVWHPSAPAGFAGEFWHVLGVRGTERQAW